MPKGLFGLGSGSMIVIFRLLLASCFTQNDRLKPEYLDYYLKVSNILNLEVSLYKWIAQSHQYGKAGCHYP